MVYKSLIELATGQQLKDILLLRFGVCCIFTLTNGGTVSQNCTYIQNPGFPSSYGSTSAINYMVTKSSSGTQLSFPSFFVSAILTHKKSKF
jgi:hypothetical protein